MIIERLSTLGYEFTPEPLEIMSFHAAVRTGNLVFTSGRVPALDDEEIKGKLGTDLTVEQGKRAAELAAFNALRAAGAVVDIEKVVKVVKVLGLVNVSPGFLETASVVNGASEFLRSVLGDNGAHARSAVGVTLPLDWAVEIELILEVAP